MVKVEYDPETNAAYIRLSLELVVDSEEVSAGIILDYGRDGHIVGIEILDAQRHLSRATREGCGA